MSTQTGTLATTVRRSGKRAGMRVKPSPDRAHRSAVKLCGAVAALGLFFTAPPPVSAQWIHYPTHDVPRTRDGAADLNAPAPRTREGRPDLSGIWYASDADSSVNVSTFPPSLLAEALQAKGPAVSPGASPDDSCLKGCITQEPFPVDGANIGRSLPGRTLPYQPWARQLVVQRLAALGKDDPHSRCAPPSYPRAFSLPQNWKIVQTPRLVVLLHEFNASYRQIFLDGRPLPVDPLPAWNGYSTGHWEKDTLVVETVGFHDGIWLDLIGSPLTEAARITERFRRLSYGTLKIEFTVNDPKAYTKPWTVTLVARLVPDTDLLEDICGGDETPPAKRMTRRSPGNERRQKVLHESWRVHRGVRAAGSAGRGSPFHRAV